MDYQYTSYGAQGGAGGGGFMNQDGGGSQASPSGRGSYSRDTLRPVTIKQVLTAQQSHPDADFRIDGQEITQITFVGQIRNISTQTTNITYRLDDGTGTIDVKQWIDPDTGGPQAPDPNSGKPALVENAYARVWGRMKAFNNKRHVGAHVIRPLDNYNEIPYHLLEAAYVHLYLTKGPPELAPGHPLNKSGADTANNTGFDNNAGSASYSNVGPGAGYGSTPTGKPLPALSVVGRRVYAALKDTPQNNEGLHVQHIASAVGMEVNDVLKGGDELLAQGLIYTTVDDQTWAILEY
ncbi:MAG: replication factor A protein 2 [Cirrosporium novae-zelandiae]|nr:MAG: replication factor A protein 2 [Cirrosporium novae-zelandiae]KAI9735563.1 MAG: replication factor A protein 2 [Cirrosporium novae-zelandiae]